MDFFEPENWFERSQSIGTLGRIAQGGRTNELLGSINQTLQQALAEEKSEKQQQRLIENIIYEMQKRLNRSRYQFEKSPNEAFALLYETKETIDQSRQQLQAVHSLEYKRLFEALEYDCSNLWDWAAQNVSQEIQAKFQQITELKKEIQILKAKKGKLPKSSLWLLNFFGVSGAICLLGYLALKKSSLNSTSQLYIVGFLFIFWLLGSLMPPKIAVWIYSRKIAKISLRLDSLIGINR